MTQHDKATFRTFLMVTLHHICLLCKSRKAQTLRPITFTQRFRTIRHLISIQLLRKPRILNEDKRMKFERSKGGLSQFSESCK